MTEPNLLLHVCFKLWWKGSNFQWLQSGVLFSATVTAPRGNSTAVEVLPSPADMACIVGEAFHDVVYVSEVTCQRPAASADGDFNLTIRISSCACACLEVPAVTDTADMEDATEDKWWIPVENDSHKGNAPFYHDFATYTAPWTWAVGSNPKWRRKRRNELAFDNVVPWKITILEQGESS